MTKEELDLLHELRQRLLRIMLSNVVNSYEQNIGIDQVWYSGMIGVIRQITDMVDLD